MPLLERITLLLQPLVTRCLQIMLVIGVIDNALDIALVVASLHLDGEQILFHVADVDAQK